MGGTICTVCSQSRKDLILPCGDCKGNICILCVNTSFENDTQPQQKRIVAALISSRVISVQCKACKQKCTEENAAKKPTEERLEAIENRIGELSQVSKTLEDLQKSIASLSELTVNAMVDTPENSDKPRSFASVLADRKPKSQQISQAVKEAVNECLNEENHKKPL